MQAVRQTIGVVDAWVCVCVCVIFTAVCRCVLFRSIQLRSVPFRSVDVMCVQSFVVLYDFAVCLCVASLTSPSCDCCTSCEQWRERMNKGYQRCLMWCRWCVRTKALFPGFSDDCFLYLSATNKPISAGPPFDARPQSFAYLCCGKKVYKKLSLRFACCCWLWLGTHSSSEFWLVFVVSVGLVGLAPASSPVAARYVRNKTSLVARFIEQIRKNRRKSQFVKNIDRTSTHFWQIPGASERVTKWHVCDWCQRPWVFE